MAEQLRRAINPALFDVNSSEPRLLASKCACCGAMVFPPKGSCMACGALDVDAVELPRVGRLWTFTIQHFMPKVPYKSLETEQSFKPFGIGYVDLPGGLILETRIPLENDEELKIGSEMALAFYTHSIDPDGTEVINYEFKPLGGSDL